MSYALVMTSICTAPFFLLLAQGAFAQEAHRYRRRRKAAPVSDGGSIQLTADEVKELARARADLDLAKPRSASAANLRSPR